MNRILLAVFLCMLCVALLSAGTPQRVQEDKPEIQLAEIYEAKMVVAEIKHQAPEPVAEETKVEKEQTPGVVTANITHYCACSKCNGKWSRAEDGVNYTATASGMTLHDGLTGNYCAATFGSLGDVIEINGTEYTIVDRMGGNSGYRIDIFVGEGHERCVELGRYKAEVKL